MSLIPVASGCSRAAAGDSVLAHLPHASLSSHGILPFPMFHLAPSDIPMSGAAHHPVYQLRRLSTCLSRYLARALVRLGSARLGGSGGATMASLCALQWHNRRPSLEMSMRGSCAGMRHCDQTE